MPYSLAFMNIVSNLSSGMPRFPNTPVISGLADVVIAHQKLAHRISFNYSPFIRYQVYFRLGAEGRRPEAPLGGLWDNFPGLASVTAAGA